MSATTTRRTDDTNEAQFLAPETPRRAGRGKKEEGANAKPKVFGDDALVPGDMALIPLSRLVPSPFNVRRSGGENVDELAALIEAQGGVLQNLVVHPDEDKKGRPTGDFGVAAGSRRRRALLQLAKAGKVSPDVEVLCKLVSRAQALAASTAENSGREPMSVADTVCAFADMVEAGGTVDEVAVCFGVSALTVQRRLKLAKVSPKLFALFRDEKITLNQLMALAITDDHAAQEKAWTSTPVYHRDPTNLRRMLLGTEIDAARDPVARYVGLAAYEAAGGVVVRDLFKDEDGGYIGDAQLLQRLALERLQAKAQKLKGEGWSWAEGRLSFDYGDRQGFGVASIGQKEPTDEQRAAMAGMNDRRDKANDELEALYDGDEADFDQERASELEAVVAKAEKEVEAMRRKLSVWTADVMAYSGVVVALDHAGSVTVHRGMVRPEDRKRMRKASAQTPSEGDAAEAAAPAMAESLVRKLTAHRTRALQVLVADHAQVALAAVVHSMLQQLVIERSYRTDSALSLRVSGCEGALTQFAGDIEASRAWSELESRLANWRERIPSDETQLMPWLLEQPQAALLDLLALCAALSINAVSGRESEHPADALAAAVGLDMADWWAPTGTSYLSSADRQAQEGRGRCAGRGIASRFPVAAVAVEGEGGDAAGIDGRRGRLGPASGGDFRARESARWGGLPGLPWRRLCRPRGPHRP